MPSSVVMRAAISSPRSASFSPMAAQNAARSSAGVCDQASKAARAALTARSASSAVPSGIAADDLLGGRIDDLDGAVPGGLDPLAADEELVPYERVRCDGHAPNDMGSGFEQQRDRAVVHECHGHARAEDAALRAGAARTRS